MDGTTAHDIDDESYVRELHRLQIELVKLQHHVQRNGLRIAILFEGRDAAGKGGMIKRITQYLNPRVARIVALAKPTDAEEGQWYFQRYVEKFPAAGEIALFDRSWYNRAGVEHVMGFCTAIEYEEFLRAAPEFERMIQNSGITLIKYWLEIDRTAQLKRLEKRSDNPLKRWKLSQIDVEARRRWYAYSRARDAIFARTDLPHSPWYVVDARHKKRARLNCFRHLLAQIPYEDRLPSRVELPRPYRDRTYREPDWARLRVPDYYD
jgi:polyphosphate kinase 2